MLLSCFNDWQEILFVMLENFSWSYLFVFRFVHEFPRRLHRLLFLYTCLLLAISSVVILLLHPKSNVNSSSDMNSLCFIRNFMSEHFFTLCSLDIVDFASANLVLFLIFVICHHLWGLGHGIWKTQPLQASIHACLRHPYDSPFNLILLFSELTFIHTLLIALPSCWWVIGVLSCCQPLIL